MEGTWFDPMKQPKRKKSSNNKVRTTNKGKREKHENTSFTPHTVHVTASGSSTIIPIELEGQIHPCPANKHKKKRMSLKQSWKRKSSIQPFVET
jgi:hypothetical protein